MEQVLRAQFISHAQLWEFLRSRRIEMSRESYCWRVRRLVQHGLLRCHRVPAISRDNVYSASASGIRLLQSAGTFYAGNPARVERNSQEPQLAHAVTLNAIHLQLMRFNLLREWVPEREIRSRNELTMEGYRKDYDAVVALDWQGWRMSFGLEYERWAKAERLYVEIASRLNREGKLDQFLYLVNGEHLRKFLMQCFRHRTSKPVYIGLAEELLSTNPATLGLIEGGRWDVTTLGSLCVRGGVYVAI